MSILEQCISYGNGELKKAEIMDLLGVIDHSTVDDIILNLLNNSIQNINQILNNSKISNYSKLLDLLIERVFQVSLSRKLNSNEYNLPLEFLVIMFLFRIFSSGILFYYRQKNRFILQFQNLITCS